MSYKSLSLGANNVMERKVEATGIGYTRHFEFVYFTECDDCGAVVTNENAHNEFHKRVEE